jgi:methionyl-tRNA formyltransferase
MRILFVGTPDIALPSLRLLNDRFDVCGVLTSPDKPSGRGRRLVAPPVKVLAESLGLTVLQPTKLGKEFRETVRGLDPELMTVVAYSRIFGPKFLSLFGRGSINLHPSLLPKHRGPSPIPAAILAGDAVTAITIQRVGLEMDAGNILCQEELIIEPGETAGELSLRIAPLGAQMLADVVGCIEDGRVQETAQDESAVTYCTLIEKGDGCIDWCTSAVEIERMVRAYNPWPVAYTTLAGSKLSILKASAYSPPDAPVECETSGMVVGVDKARGILIQTNHGMLAVEELQLQSRKVLGWKAFLNGSPGFVGSALGGD